MDWWSVATKKLRIRVKSLDFSGWAAYRALGMLKHVSSVVAVLTRRFR